MRTQEAKNAALVYGIRNLIQKDFPDDHVKEHLNDLKASIEEIFLKVQPDLVITYDLAGLYGHPDHIAVSEVITLELRKYPYTKLWYASYPKKILHAVNLPEYMAKDPAYARRRVYPTHKIWVGLSGVIHKIKATYAHKSQHHSYVKALPFPQIPLWFYISLTPFEYYHIVN